MQAELFLANSRGCHQGCRFYSSLRFYYRINVYFESNLLRRMRSNVGNNKEIKKQSYFHSLKPVFSRLQRGKLHTSSVCHIRHPHTGNNKTGGQPEGHPRSLHLRSSVMIRRNFPTEWPLRVIEDILCAAMFTVNLNLFSYLCHPSMKTYENIWRFYSCTQIKKTLGILSPIMIIKNVFSKK